MSNSTRYTLIQEALWDKKEASYDDKIEDAEANPWATSFMGEPMQITKGVLTDQDETGRGHEWRGTKRAIRNWDARLSRTRTLETRIAGWLAGFGLGSVSTADNGDGSYLHTFTPQALTTSPQLPSTTIIEHQPDEGIKRRMAGAVVDNFSISGSPLEWLQCSYEMIGSGRVDESSSLTMPSEATVVPLKWTALNTFNFGDEPSPGNVLDRVRTFSFSWSNNLLADRGYVCGATEVNSGPIRSKCEIGVRTDTSFQLTLDAEFGATTEYANFIADDLQEIEVIARGSLISGSNYHEVRIWLPECHIDECGSGWDGPVKVYNFNVVPRYSSSNTWPVRIQVQNTQSAYLAAAA